MQGQNVGEGQFVRLGRIEPGGGEYRVHAVRDGIAAAHEVEALRLERLEVFALERGHDEVLAGESELSHDGFPLRLEG